MNAPDVTGNFSLSVNVLEICADIPTLIPSYIDNNFYIGARVLIVQLLDAHFRTA